MIASLLVFCQFFVLNTTIVRGLEHLPTRRGVLYLSRHVSFPDSYLLGFIIAVRWRMVFRPWLFPWHTAARENFFHTRWLRMVAWFLKIASVTDGRKDQSLLLKLPKLVKAGSVLTFPLGGLERSGRELKPVPGIGRTIYHSKVVIPIWISDGMRDVYPPRVRNIVWRVPRGKTIEVIIGPPVELADLQTLPECRDTWVQLADRTFRAMYELGGITLPDTDAQSVAR